jgi:hypothetical protein
MLAVGYPEIRSEIGLASGLGRDPGAWSPDASEDVEKIIRSGLRRFYFYTLPEAVDEAGRKYQPPRHTWSFLQPVASLSLVSGTSTYDLPADFGEIFEGGFVISGLETGARVHRISDEKLRSLPAKSGDPAYFSVRPKSSDGVAGQRYEVVFYPTPSVARTATYRYTVAPPGISESNPYPLGGTIHAETVLEACLAELERKLDDTEGPHAKRFYECLASSISADKTLSVVPDDDPWPIGLVSELDVNKAYLMRLIGREMGYGAHSAAWTHKESSEIKLALEEGLRTFYNPMVIPGDVKAHEWSFLQPVLRITTAEDVDHYDLPEDYASILGPLNHTPSASALYPSVAIVGEHQIRARAQQSSITARPQIAAVRVKPVDATGVTRYEILFWPTPDDAYSLVGRYQSNPKMLSADTSLPIGNRQHAQTVVEACLAAAERVKGKPGLHQKEFMKCLIASVALDRQQSAPETLGINRDGSDRPQEYDHWHELDATIVTYNGQVVT